MKTKLSFVLISVLLVFVLTSCQKNKPDYSSVPTNAKLKRVLLYSNINSLEPLSIVDEYEYNDKGLISKVSSPMYDNGKIVGTIKYDLYEYNSSDQPVKIMNYNANINSPDGFINLKNTSFVYSGGGKKTKETIEYPLANYTEYSDFVYKDEQLLRVYKYYRNVLETYTEYQYDKRGRLIKEQFYTAEGKFLTFTIHSYSGNLQTQSDFYRYPDNSHYRSVTRIFDDNNNLISLESKELSLYSSMMSFILRYEYYE
jgi:hypothetical protein